MNKSLHKAVLSFVQLQHPDVEFEIETNYGDDYLMAVIDVSKMDKNSPNFDENYKKKFTPEKSHEYDFGHKTKFIENLVKSVTNFFSEKIRGGYKFKNYEYLDKIETDINQVVKKIDSNYNFTFSADSHNPILNGYFSIIDKDTDIDEFIDKVENLTKNNVKIRNNYNYFLNFKR